MSKVCSNCGAELINDSKFCSACGKKVKQQSTPPEPSKPKQDEQQPTPTQVSTTQKSKQKLIIGILGIIIVFVIAIFAIIYLLGATSSFDDVDNRFVGEWEQNTVNFPVLWKFNSDRTLENGSSETEMKNIGTWRVNDTELWLFNSTVRYNYEFSNNENTLTLTISDENSKYPEKIVLTKKGQQEATETPHLECITNSTTNRIIITSIEPNVKWKDINITTTPVTTWQIQDANEQGLAKTGTIATITTYIAPNDSILLLVTTGKIIVTMKYIPTNTVLGNWTVYV